MRIMSAFSQEVSVLDVASANAAMIVLSTSPAYAFVVAECTLIDWHMSIVRS